VASSFENYFRLARVLTVESLRCKWFAVTLANAAPGYGVAGDSIGFFFKSLLPAITKVRVLPPGLEEPPSTQQAPAQAQVQRLRRKKQM
jgi:hypothetical protein